MKDVYKLGNVSPGQVVMLFKKSSYASPLTRLQPGEPLMVIGRHDRPFLVLGAEKPEPVGLVITCLTQHGIRRVWAHEEVTDFGSL